MYSDAQCKSLICNTSVTGEGWTDFRELIMTGFLFASAAEAKRVGDQEMNIPTQCLLDSNLDRNLSLPRIHKNIALKMNAKLGGINRLIKNGSEWVKAFILVSDYLAILIELMYVCMYVCSMMLYMVHRLATIKKINK